MFRHVTLDNGLQVVAEINPAGYTASFGYFVNAGARDEHDKIAGVSHFLEHMMFKGTARRSAAEVNRELDELGGQSNAYTSEEQTVYYATVLPKYQARLVDLLTDMMRPTLHADDFETERQVIIEEIAKYDDQPPFGAFERSMEEYFRDHGLGRRVLGTVETVSSLSPDSMREYFQTWYSPSRMVFAAAGNVDFEALVRDLERLTAHWEIQPPRPPRKPPQVPVCETKCFTVTAPETAQAYLIRLGAAPGASDPDRYPMRMLGSIIGDDSGSRLFWELIDSGRAEMAATWTQEFDDCGLLFQYVVGSPEDMSSNLNLVDKILARIQDEGVEPSELQQSINKATAGLVLRSERPSSRMFSIGNAWLTRGVHEPLDEVIERYRQVTCDDIRRVIETYSLTARTEVQVE